MAGSHPRDAGDPWFPFYSQDFGPLNPPSDDLHIPSLSAFSTPSYFQNDFCQFVSQACMVGCVDSRPTSNPTDPSMPAEMPLESPMPTNIATDLPMPADPWISAEIPLDTHVQGDIQSNLGAIPSLQRVVEVSTLAATKTDPQNLDWYKRNDTNGYQIIKRALRIMRCDELLRGRHVFCTIDIDDVIAYLGFAQQLRMVGHPSSVALVLSTAKEREEMIAIFRHKVLACHTTDKKRISSIVDGPDPQMSRGRKVCPRRAYDIVISKGSSRSRSYNPELVKALRKDFQFAHVVDDFGAIIKPFQNPFFEEGIRVILSSGTEPVMAFPEWRELKMGPHHVYAYTMTLFRNAFDLRVTGRKISYPKLSGDAYHGYYQLALQAIRNECAADPLLEARTAQIFKDIGKRANVEVDSTLGLPPQASQLLPTFSEPVVQDLAISTGGWLGLGGFVGARRHQTHQRRVSF